MKEFLACVVLAVVCVVFYGGVWWLAGEALDLHDKWTFRKR
jgi:hypothetical protein